MKKGITLLLTLCILQCYAQYPPVSIPGSEVRKITSSIVAGQEYELQILLPAGYANSTKKFPVVYLMDSQWDFPLAKSIYGEQYFDGFIPELIIVGVTWGGTNPNPDSLRARDYTPSKENRAPQSGGADKFLSFMKDELFPFIEQNYKADNNNRTLMGCSLGGLFTLYSMLTHGDMFTGYIAASPAYSWDNEVLYKHEKSFFGKKTSKPSRVYMTVGEVERGAPGFEKFAKFLADRKYASLSIQSKVLENTGHSGTKNETYARGLQYVFQRPLIHPGAATLNKYLGMYEMPGGNKIEIRNENNQLEVFVSRDNKFPLQAATETDFYSISELLNVHFQTVNDTVDGFRLDTYGNTQFIKKIK
ncbi:MAG: alpha/beta hydrolase-fold protein [Ferruginibacter sp.]